MKTINLLDPIPSPYEAITVKIPEYREIDESLLDTPEPENLEHKLTEEDIERAQDIAQNIRLLNSGRYFYAEKNLLIATPYSFELTSTYLFHLKFFLDPTSIQKEENPLFKQRGDPYEYYLEDGSTLKEEADDRYIYYSIGHLIEQPIESVAIDVFGLEGNQVWRELIKKMQILDIEQRINGIIQEIDRVNYFPECEIEGMEADNLAPFDKCFITAKQRGFNSGAPSTIIVYPNSPIDQKAMTNAINEHIEKEIILIRDQLRELLYPPEIETPKRIEGEFEVPQNNYIIRLY